MEQQRSEPVDENFLSEVSGMRQCGPPAAPRPGPADASGLLELFDSQIGSRHLDLAARELGRRGSGYYSIGSAGHESNAAVAAALRHTDPALLHYRSGGFYLRRAAQRAGTTPLRDVLLGVVAAAEEPMAGGRHKVFGNAELSVLPQTSTIASHLPRAVGLAFALERSRKLGVEGEWPRDSMVVCSFGDASANHSTATGAINTALHCAYRMIPLPLLLVCEDNGIGISVPTPEGWIQRTFGSRAGLPYFAVEGDEPAECLSTAERAADWVRRHRRPAFLHLRTVRLMGHAGSDVETGYRSRAEIAAEQRRDPLLATGAALVRNGVLSPAEVVDRYEAKRAEVAETAEWALGRRKLTSSAEISAPIARETPEEIATRACSPGASTAERSASADRGGTAEPAEKEALTLAQSINRALAEELERDGRVLVFGQDVARKGGVYGVTRGLWKRFGAGRVFDTLLDEQSILGTALGAGLAGLLPVPEIQYLAYLHNAADQLRGEASTTGFFSNGRYRNPMVVRIPGYAYQRGFGGHFHNDNSVAALLDVPGLVVASPAKPDDAAAMLRTCVAAAAVDGRVCVFLEPIALYHTRDLHEHDDEGWTARYPAVGTGHVPLGTARQYFAGSDLTLVTTGNGLAMSLRAARRLAQRGVGVRVLDLRWLAPLPREQLFTAAEATGRVLIADETRTSGGISERVVTALVDSGFTGKIRRVTSADSFIPLGEAAYRVLLDETGIEKAALEML
ncbi:thiamine pyrophosphate-dependent enzyme [Actinopolyspora saharensis]|uniref:2-oxoisovalerate dehydrogenase E1 component n=1 Tax=Actinopolyspora saharensis TaxID=995062 RepID=A0A1H1AA89_9ACTN|nr:thiamine pyrophosphate-dependent enzyme [Actinopolyspora saharensis]SDQ36186.1 2-oxoisovalerate dehydrogenase E1 component [Actinopolyspora saharensis]